MISETLGTQAYNRTSYQEEYDTALRQWAWNSVNESLTLDNRFIQAEKLYNWVKTGKK
jgi:hypothetical protein